MIYKVLVQIQGDQEEVHFNTWEAREAFITEQKWKGNCIVGTCEEEEGNEGEGVYYI